MAKKKALRRRSTGDSSSSPPSDDDRDISGEAGEAERDDVDGPGLDATVEEDGKESPASKTGDAASSAGAIAAPPEDEKKKPPPGAAWARPFAVIDAGWTWFESRLLFVVLAALITALVSWVVLQGLASPIATDNAAGTVTRAVLLGVALGIVSRLATRKLPDRTRTIATIGAVAVGFAVAPLWRSVGIEYFGGMLNWLQEGSSLSLFGGLRGVGTRITILLALVGASLAAGSGKHVNMDVLTRYLPATIQRISAILGLTATAAVCCVAAYAFFDYTAYEGFKVSEDLEFERKLECQKEHPKPPQPSNAEIEKMPAAEREKLTRDSHDAWAACSNLVQPGEKVSHVLKGVGDALFIWRKQILLDLRAIPVVLKGDRWDGPERMTGQEWNTFIEEGGFYERFEEQNVKDILASEEYLDKPRHPYVVWPGGTARGSMIQPLNLTYAIGLVIIGLRMLLRAILVASRHKGTDADPDDWELEAPPVAVVKEAR